AADHLDAPLRHEPERQRIHSMLDLKNAGSERLDGIVVADGHRRLRNDRAGVGLWDDEVNRRARYFHSRLESLAVRIETGKRWKGGGVVVEQRAFTTQHEASRKQPNEPAETTHSPAMFVEPGLECALEGGAIFPVRTMVAPRRRNRPRLGACEPRRL